MRVIVYGESADDYVDSDYTDASGAYSVGGLAAWTYKVRFWDESGTYITEWYDNASSYDTGTAVAVTAGNPTTGIDASLNLRWGSISGTVTAGGVGVPNVRVIVYGASVDDSVGSDYTDASGAYSVGGLDAGTYKVQFRDENGWYATEWYDNANSYDTGTAVEVAAGNPTTGIDASLTVWGSISGTVTAGGVGVSTAYVTVYGASASDEVGSGYTDADGTYSVGGLATGTYKVKFSDWNGTYATEWYDNANSYDTGTAVEVTAGNPTTGIDASMDLWGSISGTVTVGGVGVPDVYVTVYGASASDEVSSGYTYADGAYSVGGLATGTYKVKFWDWNGTYATEWYDNASTYVAGTAVEVTAGNPTTGIDASLELGGSISGTVTAGGGGDSCVRVIVYGASASDEVRSGYTDAAGAYRVGGLRAGTYKVKFLDECGTYATEWYDNVSSYDTGTAVEVTAGNPTTGIDASLAVWGSISGTVTAGGVGVPDVHVTVYGASASDEVGSGYTDGNGTYRVSSLATGTYKVLFTHWDSDYLAEWYNDASSYDTGTAVEVTVGSPTTGIDASLNFRWGSISGTVTAGGAGVSDVRVVVCGASAEDVVGEGSTDENGTYSVGRLDAGTYKVQFRDEDERYATEWYDNASSYDTGTAVAVTAGNATTGIGASLASRWGSISGTVTAGGVGASDVEVIVYDASTGDQVRSGYTDIDGTYGVGGLAAGTYKVQFVYWDSDYLAEWYDNASSYDTGTAVHVTAGNQTTGIDASLNSRWGSISGTVTAGGVGVPDVHVTVYGASEWDEVGSGHTYADGAYSVGGLATGTYKVKFWDWNGTYATEWYDNSGSYDTGTAVEVTAGNATTGVDASLAVLGSISGTVTAGGVGISNVEVTVYGASASDGVGYSYTNAAGAYRVGGLATGTYKVQFRDWNRTYATEWYDNASSYGAGTAVEVTAGNPTTGIDASLDLGGSISGTVTAGGVGVPNVGVTVYGASADDYVGFGYTDAAGAYRVGLLAAGTYKVQFWDENGAYATEWYDNASSYDIGTAVEVTAGNPTTGIDASLDLGGSISGTVTAGGVGVSNVRVTVYGGSADDYAGFGYTDDAGAYRVGGLATGTYKVQFWDENGAYATEWYDNAGSYDTGTAVEVTAGNPTTGIDASLAVGGTINISGHVSGGGGQALAGIQVTAYAGICGRMRLQRSETDASGNYTISGLSAGNVYVSAGEEQNYVVQWWQGVAGCESATPVAVVTGQVTPNIDFTLAPGGSISGRVVDDLDQPIPGIYVRASSGACGGQLQDGQTDNSGSYTIAGLPAGNVYVSTRTYATVLDYVNEWWDGVIDCNAATPVMVTVGQVTPDINFSLVRGGGVSGQVTDGNGQPLAGTTVKAYAEACGEDYLNYTHSDASGNYTIGPLPPGQVYVEASHGPGYTTRWHDNAIDCEDATPVLVAAGQVTQNIDFSIAPPGQISGRITNGSGQPLEGIVVVVNSEVCNRDSELGNATTGADGMYTIGELPAGQWYVRTWSDGTFVDQWWDGVTDCSTAGLVTVVGGQETPGINFTLATGGSIKGHVADLEGNPLGGIYVVAYHGCGGSDSWLNYGQTDAGGDYTIPALPAGQLLVRTYSEGTAVDQWWNGVTDCSAATPVPVTVGQDTPGIDFTLSPAGPANHPPVAVNDAFATREDSPITIIAPGVLGNDTDADGESLTAVKVSDPAHGTLSFNADGSLAYTPTLNFNGPDSFTYKANDGSADSSVAIVAITVTSVNDAPSFLKGPDQTVLEDFDAQSVPAWATTISAGPTEESGQALNFTVVNDNNPLFSVQPAISAAGTLSYTPAPDANGSATVSVRLHDDGGTANGGVETSDPQTFTITVTSVNDAPSFSKGDDPVVVLEDAGAVTRAGWAKDISPGPNESGQVLTFNITGNTNPGLFAVGPAIDPGTGNLTFTPAPNANGSATITIAMSDNGGTANGGVDTSDPQTFTITVTPVDDAPVAIAVAGPDPVSCPEDANLDASQSYHPDQGRSIVSYDWDFEYDGVTFTPDATGVTVNHAYGEVGAHIAALRVTDDNTPPQTDMVTVAVEVGTVAPVASAGGPYAISEGQALVLNASGSTAPGAGCGNRIETYAWDLDGDDDYAEAEGAELTLTWEGIVEQICGGGCTLGTSYPVRVMVTDRRGFTATAEAAVTVSPLSAAVRLTSPNGGEFLGTGAEHTVRWLSQGVDRVRVYLSPNGTRGWVLLFEAAATDGAHEWAPDPAKYKMAKRTYRMRIDGYDGTAKTGSDKSDARFGIGPLDVTAPDGGEELVSGDTANVSWSTYGTSSPVTRTVIKYTVNGGVSWLTAGTLGGNPGSWSWSLPLLTKRAGKCAVRVLLYNAANQLVGQDQSEAWFTIVGRVELTAPENGHAVYGGTSRAVNWVTTTGAAIDSTLVQYTGNGGLGWKTLATISGNPGVYYWDVPVVAKTYPKCRIRIYLRNAAKATVASDSGEGWFTLLPKP